MTGNVLLRKHVTFCRAGESAIYHSRRGEVCVCESGLITRLNVFQDRLLASGRVRDETGPGVHMLWHRRSERWKSAWRCRDRWTQWHMRAWKVGHAGGPAPGCRSNGVRNWREGMSADVCLFVCERLHCVAKSMWTTQFCVILLLIVFHGCVGNIKACNNHSFRHYLLRIWRNSSTFGKLSRKLSCT